MLSIQNPPPLKKVKGQNFTPSSLLIPSSLMSYFCIRSAELGGIKHYFQYLIFTYGRHLDCYGIQPSSRKWKKEYQKEGLDLHQKNFKPDPLLWEEFRNISLAYGLAMCKFFTILLELEHKRWEEAGCPENFREKPPTNIKTYQIGVNSSQSYSKNLEFGVKNLLAGSNCSILVRSISFSAERLDRYCILR